MGPRRLRSGDLEKIGEDVGLAGDDVDAEAEARGEDRDPAGGAELDLARRRTDLRRLRRDWEMSRRSDNLLERRGRSQRLRPDWEQRDGAEAAVVVRDQICGGVMRPPARMGTVDGERRERKRGHVQQIRPRGGRGQREKLKK